MTDHTPPEVPPSQPTPDAASAAPFVPAPDAAAPVAPYGSQSPMASMYGAPAYGPPAPTALSITSFVLGLVSIFFGFLFFVPLVGLVLGILAVKKEPKARGFAIAGIWINAVMLGLVVLGVIAIVVLVAVFGAFSFPYMNQVIQNPGTPA